MLSCDTMLCNELLLASSSRMEITSFLCVFGLAPLQGTAG